MANNGNRINPKVVQYFTSGPNSGSLVSTDHDIIFDVGSSFTSSVVCNSTFNYRVFDPQKCTIPSYCISPTLLDVTPVNCGSTYDYKYRVKYNVNDTATNVPESRIEFCLNSNFTGEKDSIIIPNNNSSSITEYIVNINVLNVLPTNGESMVYFRVENACPSLLSGFSNTIGSKCIHVPEVVERERHLLGYGSNIFKACTSSDPRTSMCVEQGFLNSNYPDGFCGQIYYGDSIFWSACTTLENYDLPVQSAKSGWYSDGTLARYWNGSVFTQQAICHPQTV